MVMENERYGKTIMAMKSVETKDFNKEPWRLYKSENNESCKVTGNCDATNNLKIRDKDGFTFTYTASY